jgi:hypothetical protein
MRRPQAMPSGVCDAALAHGGGNDQTCAFRLGTCGHETKSLGREARAGAAPWRSGCRCDAVDAAHLRAVVVSVAPDAVIRTRAAICRQGSFRAADQTGAEDLRNRGARTLSSQRTPREHGDSSPIRAPRRYLAFHGASMSVLHAVRPTTPFALSPRGPLVRADDPRSLDTLGADSIAWLTLETLDESRSRGQPHGNRTLVLALLRLVNHASCPTQPASPNGRRRGRARSRQGRARRRGSGW